MPRNLPRFSPAKVGFGWFLVLVLIGGLLGGLLTLPLLIVGFVNMTLYYVLVLILWLPIVYVEYVLVWRGRTLR